MMMIVMIIMIIIDVINNDVMKWLMKLMKVMM